MTNDTNGVEAQAEKLLALIGEYWEIAYAEGVSGATHDDQDGSAQRVWSEITAAVAAIAQQPAEPRDVKCACGGSPLSGCRSATCFQKAAAAPDPAANALGGWKLVPKEPTDAMLICGGKAVFDGVDRDGEGDTADDQDAADFIYRSMLAAAPIPASDGQQAPAAAPGEVEPAMPPLPSHPDPHTYCWSMAEMKAITDFGRACIAAARAAGREHG